MIGVVLLSSCLTGTGAGGGAVAPGGEGAGDAVITAKEIDPSSPDKTADETASHPGPGGSMPSGTLAPPPLVPVGIHYKAEGTYCRFEGDESRLLVRGKLFLKVEDGDSVECFERCQDKTLRLFYQHQGEGAFLENKLDDAPDFQFEVEGADTPTFGLVLKPRPTLAVIGGAEAPISNGSFVEPHLEPYTVDGVVSPCPSRVLTKQKLQYPPSMVPVD